MTSRASVAPRAIGVAVIGCGYWGAKLARNFAAQPNARMSALCDSRAERAERLAHEYRVNRRTEAASDIFRAVDVDLVVIATPSISHYELARRAIEAGKHVLVTKPLTTRVEHAAELVELAQRQGVLLAVDHTFVYASAVHRMRDLIQGGDLGELYYIDSVRANLGLFQPDVNVLWDLAPHDFSLMTYLLDKKPIRVTASGSSPVCWQGWKRESIAYVTVALQDSAIAHFHLNWLSPVKLRRTLIGGSRKMVVYDHLDLENQVKVFDKGIELRENEDRYKVLVQYRMGDLLVPKIDQTEALETACKHF